MIRPIAIRTMFEFLLTGTARNPGTQYQVALHSEDPEGGLTQSYSESDYLGYARMPLPIDSSSWIIDEWSVSLAKKISFPNVREGHPIIKGWSIGDYSGLIYWSGLFKQPAQGVLQFSPGSAPFIDVGDITLALKPKN